MQGRVYFRDEHASVTSTEFSIGSWSLPLTDILDVRALRRRLFLFVSRYALMITTANGEREVLCHRNGYLVFQLVKALETALRETRRIGKQPSPEIKNARTVSAPTPRAPLVRVGV